MGILFLIAILAGIAWLVYHFNKRGLPDYIIDNRPYYIPDLQFSAQEFYDAIEAKLNERKIPGEILKVQFYERVGVLENTRVYLRIRKLPYTFDICAAPYGTGFFVSYWYAENIGCLTRLLFWIPFIGSYMKKRMLSRTYYVQDTEAMFHQAAHYIVMEVLDTITANKGLRKLSDVERQPCILRQRGN